MKLTTPKRRLILATAIARSVIPGTLTAPSGGRHYHADLSVSISSCPLEYFALCT
jgi:hypothetical protein